MYSFAYPSILINVSMITHAHNQVHDIVDIKCLRSTNMICNFSHFVSHDIQRH